MPEINPAKINRILVISLSNIGDVVLTTPVISLLREKFPSSYIVVLVGPKAIPLFTGCQTINEAIAFNKRVSLKEKIKLIIRLRRRKFDLVVDLKNTAIKFFLTPKYRTSFFVDRSSVSMRERHLNKIRFLFPSFGYENKFQFFNTEENKRALKKAAELSPQFKEKSFIVVAPGAGAEPKRWTLDGFAQLIRHFQEKGKSICLVGSDAERELGLRLSAMAVNPLANLIGKLSLRETAGLISNASLVVANDSAIMHLGHELNRPTVSIFGPTDEKKYGQTGPARKQVRLTFDCTPCEKAQCQIERRKCLDDLPSEKVIQACEELLSHASH